MTKKCDHPNCEHIVLIDDDKYCSETCKTDDYIHRRSKEWTTMSIRASVRDRIKDIMVDIHSKGKKEFGLSDMINVMLNLFERIVNSADDSPEGERMTVGDFIISNLDELI